MIFTFTANPSLDKLYVLNKLSIGQYNRGRVAQYDPGGKGINVSRCLAELGNESVVVGFFGGSTGDYLVKELESRKLKVAPIGIQGENRSNITIIESSSDQMTKLNELGPVATYSEMNSLLGFIQKNTSQGDIWVLSGSLPPGLPNGFYAIVIKKILACGGVPFLDASQMWLIYGYQAKPYGLRINRTEAETALGNRIPTDEDVVKAIQKFRGKGIGLSVISLDEKGAVFCRDDQILVASPPRVSAKTVVGAGDAMMAMIIHGFMLDWPLEKLARWSVAAGTASVMKEGTSVAEFDLINALVERVQIQTT